MQRDRAGVGPMGGRYGHHSALSPGFPRTALRDSLARMQKSHGTRIECCVSSFASVSGLAANTPPFVEARVPW